MNDIEIMAKAVQDTVQRWLKPFADRLKALEDRPAPDVHAAVAEAIKDLPVPKDGKDVDLAAVGAMVAEAVAALPKPADGKSITLADVQPMVSDLVKTAVAALPAAKDGKDADPAEVLRFIKEAVDAIPKPKDGIDGKSVTIDDIRPIIDEAVKSLPKPKDGKSVTIEDVRPLIDEAVKSIQAAAPDEAAVAEAVKRAVAALPVPKDGTDGKSVTTEDVRPMIADLVKQAVAQIPAPQPGKDGQDGSDGEPGRDATQIEVLDAIDVERRYQRGTYASHKGGIIRAYRATDPLEGGSDLEKCGWHIVVRGIDSIDIQMGDDMRTLSIGIKSTDGTTTVKKHSLPVVIDRGVWREKQFDPGDGTTWDGSFWIAQKSTSDKPGTSDAWRLAVKRGRDGKDAQPVSTAPRQPVRLS